MLPLMMVGLAGGLAVLYALWMMARGIYQRYKPRICMRCKIPMRLLDEQTEDAYLKDGQVIEEALGSMNHDVWICPQCDASSVEKYRSFLSSFDKCPRCGLMSLKTGTTFVSYTEELLQSQCHNVRCNYSHSVTRAPEAGSGSGPAG